MKRLLLSLILCLVCIITSGCSNYNNLDDLAIASSIIIDKKDNKYEVNIEIYKVEKGQNTIETKSFFIKGTGNNIDDAINTASLSLSKSLYFVEIKAIILTYDAIDNNLLDLSNFLARKTELNTNYYLLITKDKEKLLNNKDQDNKVLGDKVEGIIKNNINKGVVIEKDNLDLLANYTNKNIDLYLSEVIILNDEITIDSAYCFNKEKISTYLNKEELNLLAFFNKIKNNYITINNNENEYVLKIQSNKIKYNFNNEIKITLNIKSSLEYTKKNLNLKETKVINKINKDSEIYIEKKLTKLLNKLKDNKSDVIGINNIIYKKYGSLNKNFFKDKLNIKVNLEISKKGLLQNTIKGEKNEDSKQ